MIAQADLSRFKELVEQKRSLLILLAKNPDMDAVAAGLSFYLALQAQDSQVDIACPTPMRVEFNRLVGVNRIKEHVGDKNLNISFENYDAAGIEKVSYDIDNGRFNLKVVPKQGYQAPQASQVKLEYGGGAFEVVIVVKAEKRQDLGNFAEGEAFDRAQSVLVSNLPTQGFQNPIEVIDPQAASCSEVVFQILENWGWQLNQDLAGNLLMGLFAGTNNFQSQNITADTFSVASRLMQSGARLQPSQVTPQPQQIRPVPAPQQTTSPTTQPTQSSQPPEDWLQPKVYKGSKLP